MSNRNKEEIFELVMLPERHNIPSDLPSKCIVSFLDVLITFVDDIRNFQDNKDFIYAVEMLNTLEFCLRNKFTVHSLTSGKVKATIKKSEINTADKRNLIQIYKNYYRTLELTLIDDEEE